MWQLEQSIASLRADNLQCDIELASPQSGLQNTSAYQHVISQNQFVRLDMGIEQETVAEAYHRGSDLIALYASQPQREATPQLYWRALEHTNAAGIETIISLQTDLLDSRCPIHTATDLSGVLNAKALTVDDQWIAAEQASDVIALHVQLNASIGYLEIVHPTDLMNTLIKNNGDSIVWEHTVLDLQLEKGVIRRARLQSWWIQDDAEHTLANELVNAFIRSAPPLTT
ncbi:MAG: hypothetical protein CMJ76_10325 [Planctomycetaceae bacterium]|nr:hypothetical protein [Planctomycetaceae bacterium]|tara:strand:+ start:37 stop:720 length:684 start_codon:yes stop_codon:yes gene_type:complete